MPTVMDVGQLHTPHDQFGCLYYFAVDEQQPDQPRREATRYYYVLTTPSASCSEAFLFACRSLCASTELRRWYNVYQSVFARLSFDAFIGLVRGSAYWDRLSRTRKAPDEQGATEGCLQLFTDESAARSGLERHKRLALTDKEMSSPTAASARVTSGTGSETRNGRPSSRQTTARPTSSFTPEKVSRDDAIQQEQSASESRHAHPVAPFSPRRPAPAAIPTHHFDSCDDSTCGNVPTGPVQTPPSRVGLTLREEAVIELSATTSEPVHHRPTRKFGETDKDNVGVPHGDPDRSTPSPIHVAELTSALSSWRGESLPDDVQRLVAAVSHVRLPKELKGARPSAEECRSRHDEATGGVVRIDPETMREANTSPSPVEYSSSGTSRSSASSARVMPKDMRARDSLSSKISGDQTRELQKALKTAVESLARAETDHIRQERRWSEEVAKLQKEVHELSSQSSSRLQELVQDNQKEVARIEAAFANKEAEIRHVYGLALQNRDVRLVQLSEELALAQRREQEAAGRAGASEAQLAPLRLRLQESLEVNEQLQSQLRAMRVNRVAVQPAPKRHAQTSGDDSGLPSVSDDLLDALRGVERRYSDSVLYSKRLEAEIDLVRTQLAEKDAELARAHALIGTLQDGLRTVKMELPALREEWRREIMRSGQPSAATSR